MADHDDEDLKVQRASFHILADLRKSLPRLLWKSSSDRPQRVHRLVRKQELDHVIKLIEPFQEDPQLLDPDLKDLLPDIVQAYIEGLQTSTNVAARSGTLTLRSAICRILYTICKVRGEKVVVGSLNNEPRFLEPVLRELEAVEIAADEDSFNDAFESKIWQESYVLLLWLSHLLLAPFDLENISSPVSSEQIAASLTMTLPHQLPQVCLRIMPICLKHLKSATKERDSSATLLVRLALRPDMRKAGLLDSMISWVLEAISSGDTDTHLWLGVLSVLSRLVTSSNVEEIRDSIQAIYRACQKLLSKTASNNVTSFAGARKLIIKTLRDITLHCLQAQNQVALDVESVLEDVIDFLLQSMADADTPVRYAASKALSAITLKLEPSMAQAVIEAVLGSLNEDVLWTGTDRNLTAVNALRWHGLTLTLSHLLYRRAAVLDQIPEILNALILALNFEQRTATGSSVGSNVRDAACFGIWALARRYTPAELRRVSNSEIRAASAYRSDVHVQQFLATELVVSACCDPAGNIRRGSSAALQELIGRHPDTVIEGISLVQIVDFHAVGLRERATTDVAIKAAALHEIYREGLLAGMLEGWRGTNAIDAFSRDATARAIGGLSMILPFRKAAVLLSDIGSRLQKRGKNDVEERHGLLLSAARILEQHQRVTQTNFDETHASMLLLTSAVTVLAALDSIGLGEKDLTAASLRPELTFSCVLSFISELSQLSYLMSFRFKASISTEARQSITSLLQLCLIRLDDQTQALVPHAVRWVTISLEKADCMTLAYGWLNAIRQTSHSLKKVASKVIALGIVLDILRGGNDAEMSQSLEQEILSSLIDRAHPKHSIEVRINALQALQLTDKYLRYHQDTKDTDSMKGFVKSVVESIPAALDDYTIDERGDVGSLVRMEGLNTLDCMWKNGILGDKDVSSRLTSSVTRITVEKLDKLRHRASEVLDTNHLSRTGQVPFGRLAFHVGLQCGFSSYEYFKTVLQRNTGWPKITKLKMSESLFRGSFLGPDNDESCLYSVLQGYIHSAGMGTESLVQASRLALVDSLNLLPTESVEEKDRVRIPLIQVPTTLLEIFKGNLTNDRVVLPLLEVLSFLLDTNTLSRLSTPTTSTSFKWLALLSLVQKSHFKSSNMHKLHLAVDVYRGLANVPSIRKEVLNKLVSMLMHPFPKIRVKVAETLFVVTGMEEVKNVDWGQGTAGLKGIVEGIKTKIAVLSATND